MSNNNNNVQIVWGTPILDQGFANVPNVLIRNYRKLGITHAEFGLVTQLITYKHDAGNPFPSQDTLANNLDISTRAIRKLIAGLEAKDLLWVEYQYVEGKRTSNVYILKPLIDKCLELIGESKLPDEKPKRKTYRKVSRNTSDLAEHKVSKLPEPLVPNLPELEVPELPEPRVPSNITSEYNKTNTTKEQNNPSIEREVEDTGLPIPIQKQLIINQVRLIDENISISDIVITYEMNKDKVTDFEFADVLSNVLVYTKGEIRNVRTLVNKSVVNYLIDKATPIDVPIIDRPIEETETMRLFRDVMYGE